jgi:uncharacterized protein with HEPN domain
VKGDLLYVTHVLECIGRIQKYCEGGEAAFRESDLIQDGVLRNLQILAGSTQRIGDSVKARYPEVDWRAISGFRNVVVHDYLGINLDRVWRVVSTQLPLLTAQMGTLRRELEAGGQGL